MKCENPTCRSKHLVLTFTMGMPGTGVIVLYLCGACRMQLAVAMGVPQGLNEH